MRSLLVLALAACLAGCGDDPPPEEPGNVEPQIRSNPAPPRVNEDAGPSGPKPSCAAGADIEVEPNDTAAQATEVLALKFCGVLATASDVDTFTFTTPSGTKLGVFQAIVTEPVDIVVSVGGKDYAPGDAGLVTSGTFVVKISAKGDKAAGYQVRIQYDPV